MSKSSNSIFNYFSGRIDKTGVPIHVSLHWFLRVACGMCWIGHGAWGVITKAGWLPFFYTFGIPEAVAWNLMPVIGTMDIAMGIALLFYPCKANLVWMFVWTVFTALLRPMSGMGGWEFLERAGNYGPPLAFLLLATVQQGKIAWFEKIRPQKVDPAKLKYVIWTLRGAIALLLIGHGGFGAYEQKQVLIDHWQAIGLNATATTITWIGWGEIIAGFFALGISSRFFFMAILYWKLFTELLYPVAGRLVDTWEWVERGGNYGAPLALISLLILMTFKDSSEHEAPEATPPEKLIPVEA